MREDELEADQKRGGQRCQLPRRPPPRIERRGNRASEHRRDQRQLHEVEVGNAGGVVLPPIPDRERRLTRELPRQRPVPEDTGGVQRVGLQEQDREGSDRGNCEPCRVADEPTQAPKAERRGVGRPERRDDERAELRPAGERREGPTCPARRDEPEAPDQEQRGQRVVRVRVRGVLRERIGRPRKREDARQGQTTEPPADEDEAEHRE